MRPLWVGALGLAGCCECAVPACDQPAAVPSDPVGEVPLDSVFHTTWTTLPEPLVVYDAVSRRELDAEVLPTDFGFTIVPLGLEPDKLYRIDPLTQFWTSAESGLPPPTTIEPAAIESRRTRPVSTACCRFDSDLVHIRWELSGREGILGWQLGVTHAGETATVFTTSPHEVVVGDGPNTCLPLDLATEPELELRFRPYARDGQLGEWSAPRTIVYEP